MPETENIKTFNSCLKAFTYAQQLYSQAKSGKIKIEEKIKIKPAFMVFGDYLFSTDQVEDESTLMFGIIATKNPFYGMKVRIDINSSSTLKNFSPLIKTFHYGDNPDVMNTEYVKEPLDEIEAVIKIVVNPDKEKSSFKIFLSEINKIDRKDIAEVAQQQERAFNIINKYPFLIGFLGIKHITIPVIFDNDSNFNNFPELHTFALTSAYSLNSLIQPILVSSEKSKPFNIDVPVFLGERKILLLMSDLNQDILNIFRSNDIPLNNHLYSNNSTFIPIIVMPLENIFDTTNLQINELLKSGTYVNSMIVKLYKDEIKELIKADAIEEEELSKIGITSDELKLILRLTGLMLKSEYKIDRETLFNLSSSFNLKAFISTENKNITNVDIETMVAIISFVDSAGTLYKNMEKTKAIHEIIEKVVTVNLDEFKNNLKEKFGIDDKRVNSIMKTAIENEAVLETVEDDDKKLKMTKQALDFIKEQLVKKNDTI